MKKKWVLLKYKGMEYYGIMISEDGEIQNIKTGNVYTSYIENRCEYVNMGYNGKSVRINIGMAQEESGLEVTKPRLEKGIKRKSNKPSTREILEDILERLEKLESR